jgi:Carboxypeptidase regulatory-like domain
LIAIARASLFGVLLLAAFGPAGVAAAAGTISGSVTDGSTGAGIDSAEVCAWPLWDTGEEWEGIGGCTEPAPSGAYSLGDLVPGEYEVQFFPYASSYVTQWYDGALDPADADPVTVADGGTTPEIDAALTEAKGAIEGKVTSSVTGNPVAAVEVCAYQGNVGWLINCVETDGAGEYRVGALPSAEYYLEFNASGTGLNLAPQVYDHAYIADDADPVEVAEVTVTGVNAVLDAGAEISGRLYAAAGGAPLANVRVCLWRVWEDSKWACGRSNATGSYRFNRLPPLSYKVGLSSDYGLFPNGADPEDDGYLEQFWNNKPSRTSADVLALATGAQVSGVDAHLISSAPVSPALQAPVLRPPIHHRKPLRCKRGFRKKRLKGKVRCVKVHKRRHHRHGRHRGAHKRPLFDAQAPAAVPPLGDFVR